MNRATSIVLLFASTAGIASAQPYGWLSGSSQDTPKTGNRMVIVDLGAGTVVGPADGWLYQADNPGADPTVTTFSPDGAIAYVIVGGDGNGDTSTGRLHLYDTAATIAALQAATTVPPPIQTIEYLSSNEDAIEPVAVTAPVQGDRVYVMEGKERLLHVYDVGGDRRLTEVTAIAAGSQPGPLWVTSTGDKGYYVNFDLFQAQAVDLRANPPAVVATIALAPPTKANSNSFAATYGSFTMQPGSQSTLHQYGGEVPADDTKFICFSGYFGAKASNTPFPGFTVINDNFRMYSVNTATEVATMDLDYSPGSSEVIFPPTVHSFAAPGVGTYTNIGGSLVVRPSAGRDKITLPDTDQMLAYGMMPSGTTSFFFGSVAVPALSGFLGGQYTPITNHSKLYRYDPSGTRATVAATAVLQVERYNSVVLGYANGRVVVGGNDNFDLPAFDGIGAPAPRDTQLITYDPAGGSSTVINTMIVSGAYGQQPVAGNPPTATPTAAPTASPTAAPTASPTASPSASPSPSPTPTATASPTPAPSASPTPAPSASPTAPPATPTPIPGDADGDGFGDGVESGHGSNPNDSHSVPDYGDFNNDGVTDEEDGMELFRAASGGPIMPYDADLDFNVDATVDQADAMILYNWATSQGGVSIIPTP